MPLTTEGRCRRAFRFSYRQRDQLLAYICDEILLLNNQYRQQADYSSSPYIVEVETTHRNAFLRLVEQEIDVMRVVRSVEKHRRPNRRGAPRKEAIQYFANRVATYIESTLGIAPTVTHNSGSRGGLFAKIISLSLKAAKIGRFPKDPYRLILVAVRNLDTTRDQDFLVGNEDAAIKGNTRTGLKIRGKCFPCWNPHHRHTASAAAERCKPSDIVSRWRAIESAKKT